MCEFGDAFDRYYLGKSPLEDPQLYFRKSPFYRLDKVRTPTLIFFGTEDRVVPAAAGLGAVPRPATAGQGRGALRAVPRREARLKKLAHRRRKLEEELAWFDRHLFGTVEGGRTRLVKEDSPLAWALKRRRRRREAGRYGVAGEGRAGPGDGDATAGCDVGRFEVTRAQFAAFDPSSTPSSRAARTTRQRA